jgi:hypothetical protein
MALTLEANYSKKIGLPGYSSHQYSLSLKTELSDISQAEAESARLHQTLQTSVDRELKKVGFLPTATNSNGNTPEHTNGHSGNSDKVSVNGKPEAWACSDKQRDLIVSFTEEHKLDKTMVDNLAIERFGHGVKKLNKLQASGLIDELAYPSTEGFTETFTECDMRSFEQLFVMDTS